MDQIKFDKSKHYYNSKTNKSYGQGVWFKDINGDGKYNQGESMIPIGNRIKNSNNSYVQLNSDGSRTTLYSNGKFTNTNISNVDRQAISKGLVYGRNATLQNNKYVRATKGKSSWDIDTMRQKNSDGSYTDINNNISFVANKNKYIGTIGSKDVIDVNNNRISNDGGNTWSGTPVNKASSSPFITRRYGTQPLGQYLNPDTHTKTNYAEVNFGNTNGQNQYLKNNYWVYDDGNGNVQTIGFRYKDGKDYAFLNDDNNFLNNNVSGTLRSKQSIGSSRLKSYGAGFTPGMEKWRGKGGWYTNVGQALPDAVYGARDGYLYNKQGQQIGFNANGTYYLKNGIPHENQQSLSTKNWTLGKEFSGRWNDAKNNFVEGWSGLGNDIANLAGRFYKPQSFGQRVTGIFGDTGRGIQHLAQGTLGTIMATQMPQLGKKYIANAGQLLDPGKDLRTITSAFGNGKWVTPWDEQNHGLADYGDDAVSKQQYQDINDAVNGALILASAGEAGAAKGAVSSAVKGALRGSRTLRAAEAVGKGLGGAAKDLGNIYSKGAYYAGKVTKAGLRPSNIAPMADAVRQGFKNVRNYYRESAPVVEAKPVYTGTKQYIQPTIGKLSPNKGAEVVYNMKVDPKAVATEMLNEPKFVFKKNTIIKDPRKTYIQPSLGKVSPDKVAQIGRTIRGPIYDVENMPKLLPAKIEQPIVRAPKQLQLQFQENKAQYVKPTLTQLSDANNTSNVGYLPTKNIKYVDQPNTVNNTKTIQWDQAKNVKPAPKPNKVMKPKSKTKLMKKVNKRYLGGILTNNRFDNWINANS